MYYPIDETTARRSHDMMSMLDYREGSATAEYRAAVDVAAALVERQKQKVSPFYHDKLDALLDRYARRLAQWTNDHNLNGASCPSVLVCSPANFPTRKKAKQNAREDSLWKEYNEIQSILSKIKSVGPAHPTGPHVRELLEDRLQSLKNKLETGKAMNAHYRKHKTMQGFRDLSDETAAKMDEAIRNAPAFAQTPFPDFELASIRGKIKRTQENLAKLDKMDVDRDKPDKEERFEGGYSVEAWDLFTWDETAKIMSGIISGGKFFRAEPEIVDGKLEPGYMRNGLDVSWLGKLAAHGYYPDGLKKTVTKSTLALKIVEDNSDFPQFSLLI